MIRRNFEHYLYSVLWSIDIAWWFVCSFWKRNRFQWRAYLLLISYGKYKLYHAKRGEDELQKGGKPRNPQLHTMTFLFFTKILCLYLPFQSISIQFDFGWKNFHSLKSSRGITTTYIYSWTTSDFWVTITIYVYVQVFTIQYCKTLYPFNGSKTPVTWNSEWAILTTIPSYIV